MPGIPTGSVADWLEHDEQGSAFAVVQGNAGIAPGLCSLELQPAAVLDALLASSASGHLGEPTSSRVASMISSSNKSSAVAASFLYSPSSDPCRSSKNLKRRRGPCLTPMPSLALCAGHSRSRRQCV
jgi:hypothetical protein